MATGIQISSMRSDFQRQARIYDAQGPDRPGRADGILQQNEAPVDFFEGASQPTETDKAMTVVAGATSVLLAGAIVYVCAALKFALQLRD